MQCEYCERTFERGPYKRVLRGKPHVFCSESCFNLYHYKFPKFDMEKMYSDRIYSVPAAVIEEVLEEARK